MLDFVIHHILYVSRFAFFCLVKLFLPFNVFFFPDEPFNLNVKGILWVLFMFTSSEIIIIVTRPLGNN